jgi:hypothetical protein
MDIINIFLNNLFAVPILFFLSGILFSICKMNFLFRKNFHSLLTCFLLFCVGLKGGGSLMQHSTPQFFSLLIILIGWGLIQPFISYKILRKFTSTDSSTAAVIAACFGSVSLMTFAAAVTFLEKLNIPYETLVIPILAILEIPAIFSGLFISSWKNHPDSPLTKNLWVHIFFNKSILLIFVGLATGVILYKLNASSLQTSILLAFKPCLYFFLFNMGLLMGKQRKELHQFSWSLSLFGCYMPLIGGVFGVLLGYFFNLDVGTATLIAVLTASASYIAVPAAFKIALPEAKETIYIPLSLGITFPFNILIGIPTYHLIAVKLLN